MSEKDVFAHLLGRLPGSGRPLIATEQFDDAALVSVSDSMSLVISTDFIRGPQFNMAEAGYLTFRDLAHYLVAANASDIAAMGARPTGFLDVFRYPMETTPSVQAEFLNGLGEAAKHYGVEIVGGDSGTYSTFVLSGTCFGFMDATRALRRNGARPGEVLCFAGNLGLSRAAQIHFLSSEDRAPLSPEAESELLVAWRRPAPPLALGPYLSELGLSHAAQDTSDGLGQTIASICELSDVGVVIDATSLPIRPVLNDVAAAVGRSPLGVALSTSPDFGLLFTVKEADLEIVLNNPLNIKVFAIGRVTEEKEVLIVVDGTARAMSFEQWSQGTFTV